MNDTQIEKEIKDIGLSEKEATVYSVLLEKRQASALEISRLAGIKRPNTYVVLESLIKKGLVSTVYVAGKKSKKKFYAVESPENLLRLLEEKFNDLERRKNEFVKILPKLVDRFKNAGNRPIVSFFDGIEGIRSIRNSIMGESVKEVYGILSIDQLYKMFPNHDREVSKLRIKKRTRGKAIYTSKTIRLDDTGKLRETRYVPYEFLGDEGDLTIYNDKIALSSLKGNPAGIVIEHRGLANFLKKVFNLAWEGALVVEKKDKKSKTIDKK